jgi:CysZ protein
MFTALARSFGQLPDPVFRRVMVRSLLWSILVYVVLVAACWQIVENVSLLQNGLLDVMVRLAAGVAAVALATLFFPGIVMGVEGFMLEDVAQAVDRRHYPHLPARPQGWGELIASTVRLLLATVVLNVLALPVYLFVPGLNLVVFYLLNGYLLGREYFELAAMRRMDFAAARRLRRRHGWRVIEAGALITVLLSIPVAGWFFPVVATAFMVHLVEELRQYD